jgi:hypothetical protein
MRRAGLIFAMLVFVAMPVGAGASGHASLAMLAFTGLFLLANAVMRPVAVRLDRPGALALQALTAGAFAALLVGLGQSLRALAQIEGSVGLFGWVFAGAWALVLARLVWPPRMNDTAARSAEAALREVHRSGERARQATAEREAERQRKAAERDRARRRALRGRPEDRPGEPTDPAPRPEAPPSAEGVSAVESPPPEAPRIDPVLRPALVALDALPDSASLKDIRVALNDLEAEFAADVVFDALKVRAAPDRPARDRRALLLHSVDPVLGARQPGAGEAAAAFEAIVAAADAGSLAEFLTLADDLLDADPEARADLPAVARLIEIADQIEETHEEQAEALISLAHRLEDLALEAENGADA